MRSTFKSIKAFCVVLLAMGVAQASPPSGRHQGAHTWRKHPITLSDELQVASPNWVTLSPDGKMLAYGIRQLNIGGGATVDVYLAAVLPTSSPARLALAHNNAELSDFRWSADSSSLYFVDKGSFQEGGPRLRRYDIRTQKTATVLQLGKLEAFGRGPFSDSPSNVVFSPNGRLVAFVVESMRQSQAITRKSNGLGIPVPDSDWKLGGMADGQTRSVTRLLRVYDLAARKSRALTDASILVDSLDWAPDSKRIAFSGTLPGQASFQSFMNAAIYIANIDPLRVERLTNLAGANSNPVWSPSGDQIAFLSQRGKADWTYSADVAIVNVASRRITFPISSLQKIANVRIDSYLYWSQRSGLAISNVRFHMGQHVFESAGGKPVQLSDCTAKEDRTYSYVSWSSDGARMAFSDQGVGVPPRIHVVDRTGCTDQLSIDLNPAWRELEIPTVTDVQWKSRDGRWMIHGLLITPPDVGSRPQLPMIVVSQGGPTMADQTVRPRDNYPILTLADMGYAILLPNSRGREGYGSRFRHAIRDEGSYVGNPAQDVIAGVDSMIDRGIANPSRLAAIGFSYGETLTMAVLVADTRYKAAIVGGGASDLLVALMDPNLSEADWPIYRDLYGFRERYDPKEIQKMFDQTAIFHLDRVKTPVLIESGQLDRYRERQRLFGGLRAFGLPTEHIVYPNSGHGWQESASLLMDSYRRHLAWLEYWVRDKPYSNRNLQRSYDSWKALNRGFSNP